MLRLAATITLLLIHSAHAYPDDTSAFCRGANPNNGISLGIRPIEVRHG